MFDKLMHRIKIYIFIEKPNTKISIENEYFSVLSYPLVFRNVFTQYEEEEEKQQQRQHPFTFT